MIDPSLAVQIAITAALATGGGVGAPVADELPAGASLPYVKTGDDQVVANGADCLDRAVDVHSTLHVYSGLFSSREVKTIAGAIVDRLDGVALDLGPDWGLVEVRHTGTRYLDEPDGSKHAVVTFTTLADPA